MSRALIEISDLCHSYQGQEVLHHINLKIFPGDFISIIGPNGGGKTTLLKIIIGLLKPTRGKIYIKGEESCRGNTSIGYVPQYINHNLAFPATALDVVLMGEHNPSRRFFFKHNKKSRDAAYHALEKIGIAHCADKKISGLSGGQRQRVLIARALVSSPEILILDEPTASIDTKGQTDFYNLLQELNRDLSIVMVSHDLLMLSSYVKSFACLNKGLRYYPNFASFNEVVEAFYSCSVTGPCLSKNLSKNTIAMTQKGEKL